MHFLAVLYFLAVKTLFFEFRLWLSTCDGKSKIGGHDLSPMASFCQKITNPVSVLTLSAANASYEWVFVTFIVFSRKTCSATKINIVRLLKPNMFRIDTSCGKRVLPAIFVTVLLSHTHTVHLWRQVGILRHRHTLEKALF